MIWTDQQAADIVETIHSVDLAEHNQTSIRGKVNQDKHHSLENSNNKLTKTSKASASVKIIEILSVTKLNIKQAEGRQHSETAKETNMSSIVKIIQIKASMTPEKTNSLSNNNVVTNKHQVTLKNSYAKCKHHGQPWRLHSHNT